MLSWPVCVSVLFRSWRLESDMSKVDCAVAMIAVLVDVHIDRTLHVVADAA
jgi:hypothetical protein